MTLQRKTLFKNFNENRVTFVKDKVREVKTGDSGSQGSEKLQKWIRDLLSVKAIRPSYLLTDTH